MFLSDEVTAGSLAAGVTPDVLCQVEQVDALEYVAGRLADLSPGSADLDRIGRTLDTLGELPAGGVRPCACGGAIPTTGTVAERTPDSVHGWDIDEMCRWSARAADLVDGDRLLHTDPHRDQAAWCPANLASRAGHV
ncbi:MAG TPA: hypothetical protein VGG05_12235 [Pseudonocardiaceae bacterium]